MAAEGTGPDDDPLLRAERIESHAAGQAAGHASGRAEGRRETRHAAVLQVLTTRGVEVSAALPRHLLELEGISTAALVRAALECRDEADFLRLARSARGG